MVRSGEETNRHSSPRRFSRRPSLALLFAVASMFGTGSVIAQGGPPPDAGSAGKFQYRPPPCDRSFWDRILEKQREQDRRHFQRSAADEREGPRLAAQGLEGCKG